MTPWSEEQVNHVCHYFVAKFLEMKLLGQRVSTLKKFYKYCQIVVQKGCVTFHSIHSLPEYLFLSSPLLKPVIKINCSWLLFRSPPFTAPLCISLASTFSFSMAHTLHIFTAYLFIYFIHPPLPT